jgi:flagellar assembly factor FliW
MGKKQIETTRFGLVDIDESSIITFVSPILGFDAVKEYVLLDHAEDSPFKWLQAVETADLAFVITNPSLFNIPYEFVLPEEAAQKLALTSAEELVVFTIVNIPAENVSLMTANLMAPLIINQATMQAMQVPLPDERFATRTRLLPATSAEAPSIDEAKVGQPAEKG